MEFTKLQKDMVAAMKARDKVRKDAISSVISAVKKVAIDEGCRDNIDDALVDRVILKELKSVKEQIDTCPADRLQMLENYKDQMKIVAEFAPTLITDPIAIEVLVNYYAKEANIELVKQNRGTVMKLVAANLKGKADMSIVSKVIGGMLK